MLAALGVQDVIQQRGKAAFRSSSSEIEQHRAGSLSGWESFVRGFPWDLSQLHGFLLLS